MYLRHALIHASDKSALADVYVIHRVYMYLVHVICVYACRTDVYILQMEITNDVQFLLPIMSTIMVAKWVGDFVTHPLYHALLELKCIPFLDAEPVIVNSNKKM